MNPVSSLLRIVSGLVLIAMSFVTYQNNRAHIAAGEPATVLGIELGSSGHHLTVAFLVIGLVGLGLAVLGAVGFLKGRR